MATTIEPVAGREGMRIYPWVIAIFGMLALFLSTANAQTIPLLVAAQNATRGPQWWYMSVLIIIMIVPVIFLTLILQRFIAKGLLLGAVKG